MLLREEVTSPDTYIYEDRIDRVTGYVNIYDVLALSVDKDQSIEEFVQPVDYVPNTLAIDKLFFRMQKNRQTIVIAVDEYGGCDGIVTIEDIMEELVGRLQKNTRFSNHSLNK